MLIKSKNKKGKVHVEKREAFKESLNGFFDIAHADALTMIKIPEDRKFLLAQREEPRRGRIAGIDTALAKKESAAAARAKKLEEWKEKYEKANQPIGDDVFLSSSSCSETEDTTDAVTFRSLDEPGSSRKRLKKINKVVSPELASTLDRTKVSDLKATAILVSAAGSFGVDPAEFNISFRSIRRARSNQRKNTAKRITKNFSPTVPLTVHWDGKLLPDITGADVVDRLPVLVTGKDLEQLLGVPKISSGTGQATATAVYETLEHWGLTENVKAMCFDTTASNTGQRKGACILIEQKLDKSLLHLACRHHICEIVLEAVFTNRLVGVSSGPDILVFKRFKSAWRSIDKSKYTTSITDAFTAQAVADCKDDIIAFAREMLLSQQPRDEYKELLELVIIFLGSSPSREVPVHFMAPGALHRARWMAKAIYAIKIWIFKEQFRLTKREEEGLRDLAIFVSCIYLKMWFLAPLPTAAPNNDLITLKKLHDYKNINEGIASVAIRKALSHLWYLGEELVSLAFFDRNVSTETKRKMVAALSDESPDPENVAKKATLTANAIMLSPRKA